MNLPAQTIRLVLIGLLVIAPWFFGAVWAQVQWILMLVVGLLMSLELVTRFGQDDRPNLIPASWLPLLAGLVLGLIQLVNWPGGLAETMAPRTLQLRAELTSSNGESDVPVSQMGNAIGVTQRTRSVYPLATREYLALLALAMSVFVLASIHLVNKQSVVWTLVAVAICGTALSFFGLIQRLSWNGKFYWVIEPLSGGFQSFGPFVNRNNAGGFLNLCLAASVGLLVWLHWKPAAEGTDEAAFRGRGGRGGGRGRGRGANRNGGPRRGRSRSQSPTRTAEDGGSNTAASDFEAADTQTAAGDQPAAAGESSTDDAQLASNAPANETTTEQVDAESSVVMGRVERIVRREETPSPLDDQDSEEENVSAKTESFEDQLRAAYEASRAESLSAEAPEAPEPKVSAPDAPAPVSPESVSPDAGASQEGATDRESRGRKSRSTSSSASSRSDKPSRERSRSTRFGDAAYPGAYQAPGGKMNLWGSVTSTASNYFAELNAPRVWALLLVAFSAGGVLSSASRGSILAMFAAHHGDDHRIDVLARAAWLCRRLARHARRGSGADELGRADGLRTAPIRNDLRTKLTRPRPTAQLDRSHTRCPAVSLARNRLGHLSMGL